MALLRCETFGLKEIRPITEKQKENSVLNEKETLEGKKILTAYPKRLFLEMTSACNINCKMCGRNAADFKATMFDPNYLSIFEPFSDKIEEVTLMGWGEPTLHPNFEEFLKWAYERNIRKYFCTNGTKLKELKKAIFDYEVELLTVSLDGANPDTNNEIRCGADFETITENIREITKEKSRRGVEYPYITLVMTMMESNYQQMPDYVRLAHDLGVQEIKGVYLTVFEKRLLDESLIDKQEDVRKVLDETIKVGEELGVHVKLPYIQGEDPADKSEHKNCYLAWRDFYLGSDGYVRSCMHTSKKLFHVSKYKTFKEMWNSEEYQDLRSRVNNEKMNLNCRNCYHATYGNWNKRSCFVQIGNEFSPTWEKE